MKKSRFSEEQIALKEHQAGLAVALPAGSADLIATSLSRRTA